MSEVRMYIKKAIDVSALDEELIRRALEKKIARRREDLIVRDLKPTDIGLSNDVWTEDFSGGTANSWNRVTPSSGKDVEDKIIGIYGVANDASTPLTVGLRFTQGAEGRDVEVRGEYFFQEMYVKQEPKAVFSEPVIFEDDETMNIYAYIRATGTDGLILRGRVVEPASKVVGKGSR